MFLSKASALFVAVVCLVSLSVSKANEVDDWVNSRDRCPWTGPTCIEDCRGRKDGYHQSCHGCSFYAHCSCGHIHYHNCPAGKVWDDTLKRCSQKSKTCYCYPEPENCTTTGSRCIRSCKGRSDGDYQSCHGCSIYASCVAERILYDYRPCAPANPPLQWDDISKICNYTSRTCHCYRETENCTTTGSRCIRSCKGLPDGDYQSCHGCSIYASCVGGRILYDYRPCAPATPPLQWDDISKTCNYTSRTCHCYRETQEVQDRLLWSEILKK